jgi:hypothetical protein
MSVSASRPAGSRHAGRGGFNQQNIDLLGHRVEFSDQRRVLEGAPRWGATGSKHPAFATGLCGHERLRLSLYSVITVADRATLTP